MNPGPFEGKSEMQIPHSFSRAPAKRPTRGLGMAAVRVFSATCKATRLRACAAR